MDKKIYILYLSLILFFIPNICLSTEDKVITVISEIEIIEPQSLIKYVQIIKGGRSFFYYISDPRNLGNNPESEDVIDNFSEVLGIDRAALETATGKKDSYQIIKEMANKRVLGKLFAEKKLNYLIIKNEEMLNTLNDYEKFIDTIVDEFEIPKNTSLGTFIDKINSFINERYFTYTAYEQIFKDKERIEKELKDLGKSAKPSFTKDYFIAHWVPITIVLLPIIVIGALIASFITNYFKPKSTQNDSLQVFKTREKQIGMDVDSLLKRLIRESFEKSSESSKKILESKLEVYGINPNKIKFPDDDLLKKLSILTKVQKLILQDLPVTIVESPDGEGENGPFKKENEITQFESFLHDYIEDNSHPPEKKHNWEKKQYFLNILLSIFEKNIKEYHVELKKLIEFKNKTEVYIDDIKIRKKIDAPLDEVFNLLRDTEIDVRFLTDITGEDEIESMKFLNQHKTIIQNHLSEKKLPVIIKAIDFGVNRLHKLQNELQRQGQSKKMIISGDYIDNTYFISNWTEFKRRYLKGVKSILEKNGGINRLEGLTESYIIPAQSWNNIFSFAFRSNALIKTYLMKNNTHNFGEIRIIYSIIANSLYFFLKYHGIEPQIIEFGCSDFDKKIYDEAMGNNHFSQVLLDSKNRDAIEKDIRSWAPEKVIDVESWGYNYKEDEEKSKKSTVYIARYYDRN